MNDLIAFLTSNAQLAFAFLKLVTETLGQRQKYVQN